MQEATSKLDGIIAYWCLLFNIKEDEFHHQQNASSHLLYKANFNVNKIWLFLFIL